MVKLLLSKYILFAFLLSCFYFKPYSFGLDKQIKNDKICPIAQITSDIVKDSKIYRLFGQGIPFRIIDKDNKNSSSDTVYVLTLAHIIHGASTIKIKCPQLILTEEESKLSVIGESVTYDLAVLKFNNFDSIKNKMESIKVMSISTTNTFGLMPDLSQLKLDTSILDDESYSFVWVENNQYKTANAGHSPGLWPKTNSILPYNWEYTSINGVRPGMSGSILIGTPKSVSKNVDSSKKYSFFLAGMLAKTEVNAPYSISIPFEEIIPLLGSLLQGKDPRVEMNKKSGIYTTIDFSYSKKGKSLIRKRILNLYVSTSDQPIILAEDICSRGEYEPVSDWYEFSDGGATGADVDGGATGADVDGGATAADVDNGAKGEGVSTDSRNRTNSETHFSATQNDAIQIENKDSASKEFYRSRSAFFRNRKCFQQGVKIFMQKDNDKISLNLIGIKVQDARGRLRVDSVIDLLNIEPFVEYINTYEDFIQHIIDNGIFSDTKKNSQLNVTAQQTSNTSNAFTYFCRTYPNLTLNQIPPGHYFYNYIADKLQSSNFSEPTEAPNFVRVPEFISYISSGTSFVKSFEDFQKIMLIHSSTLIDDPSKNGYFCSSKNYIMNVKSPQKAEDKDLSYQLNLKIDFQKKLLSFKLLLNKSLSPLTAETTVPYVIEVNSFELKNNWSQYIVLDSGDKIDIHFDPSLFTWKFNIQLHETSKQQNTYPLRLIQLFYQTTNL